MYKGFVITKLSFGTVCVHLTTNVYYQQRGVLCDHHKEKLTDYHASTGAGSKLKMGGGGGGGGYSLWYGSLE